MSDINNNNVENNNEERPLTRIETERIARKALKNAKEDEWLNQQDTPAPEEIVEDLDDAYPFHLPENFQFFKKRSHNYPHEQWTVGEIMNKSFITTIVLRFKLPYTLFCALSLACSRGKSLLPLAHCKQPIRFALFLKLPYPLIINSDWLVYPHLQAYGHS